MKKLNQYPGDYTLSKCPCNNLEVWKIPKLIYHAVSKHPIFTTNYFLCLQISLLTEKTILTF